MEDLRKADTEEGGCLLLIGKPCEDWILLSERRRAWEESDLRDRLLPREPGGARLLEPNLFGQAGASRRVQTPKRASQLSRHQHQHHRQQHLSSKRTELLRIVGWLLQAPSKLLC